MTAPALQNQRYFDDVAVGDEFEEFEQPTTEQVIAFIDSGAAGRPSSQRDPGRERFKDAHAARGQGMERAIVPGTMSTAIITRTVTNWMGPLGRIVSFDISFRRPVLHDDRLRCLVVVTEAGDDALEAGGPAIVRLDVALENDRGERPVQGTAEVELPRRM